MTGYSSFFGAAAEIAGTLTGLLFVAISLSPHDWQGDATPFPFRARTTTAFTALVDALVLSLTALLPGDSAGTAALVVSIFGLSTTAGLIVRGVQRWQGGRNLRGLLAVALVGAAYLVQLVDSTYLLTGAARLGALQTQAFLVIAFFLIAIERAWGIIGGRDSRLLSVITEVARNRAGVAADAESSDGAPVSTVHSE
jgi:hypothetical protein